MTVLTIFKVWPTHLTKMLTHDEDSDNDPDVGPTLLVLRGIIILQV